MLLLASLPVVTFYLHNIGCSVIEAEWRDEEIDSALFRDSILHGLAQAKQHHATGWIADDRRLGPLLPNDLEWIAQEVLPALAHMGVKRLAMVESEDLLNRELIYDAYNEPLITLGIEIRRFAELAEARAWACR